MTTREQKRLLLENMTELLELPESAYEKATKRYEDLGAWFDRDDSLVKDNNPHVFPQGSFRLGTAIRPLDEHEAYDLDLACKLRDGISKNSHTQESLKKLVGQELELYRNTRGIRAPKEERHRCWRLEYQDDLSFHMDIVPCIPADETKRKLILESMRKSGVEEFVAGSVSQLTVVITDDRHSGYRKICEDWNISNPEGYAKWFEFRMNPSRMRTLMEKAQVDEVPIFKRKSPLQRSIQLLKRHRDQMFRGNEDVKPISIIITTLAARAYDGEQDVESALTSILSKMGNLVNANEPRVPNPADPQEDFADRWAMPQYKHLQLEDNFFLWLQAAKAAFANLLSSDDASFIAEHAMEKFAAKLEESDLRSRLGITASSIAASPVIHVIQNSSKPWGS